MFGIVFDGTERAQDKQQDCWAHLRTQVTWRPWIYIVDLLQQWSVTWERPEGRDSNVCQAQVLDAKIKSHWWR